MALEKTKLNNKMIYPKIPRSLAEIVKQGKLNAKDRALNHVPTAIMHKDDLAQLLFIQSVEAGLNLARIAQSIDVRPLYKKVETSTVRLLLNPVLINEINRLNHAHDIAVCHIITAAIHFARLDQNGNVMYTPPTELKTTSNIITPKAQSDFQQTLAVA